MEHDIAKVVGQCICDYREANKLSKSDLANLINKSRVTVSKYESGEINIDIATLYQITGALGLELSHLINAATAQIYNMEINKRLSSPNEAGMTYFLYYYDGRKNELSKSFILLSPTAEDGSYDVSLFYIVKDLDSPTDCEIFYSGTAMKSANHMNFIFHNTNNPIENMYLIAKEPFHRQGALHGILVGISSIDERPISFNVLLSEQMIPDEDELAESLKIDTQELSAIQDVNGLIITEPA